MWSRKPCWGCVIARGMLLQSAERGPTCPACSAECAAQLFSSRAAGRRCGSTSRNRCEPPPRVLGRVDADGTELGRIFLALAGRATKCTRPAGREGPYRMSSRQFGCQVPRKKGKRWRSPGLQAPLTPFLFTERDTTMGWKIKMEETKLKRGWGTYRFRHWKHNTETPRAKHGASELCSQQNSQLIGPLRSELHSELHREPRRKLGFKPAARRAEQPALQPAGRSSPGALCARASAETRAGTLRTCGS
jgi:hypothetical protein